jgi:hypothetical protein
MTEQREREWLSVSSIITSSGGGLEHSNASEQIGWSSTGGAAPLHSRRDNGDLIAHENRRENTSGCLF